MARWGEMRKVLLDVDCCSELSGMDVDVMVPRFSEILLQTAEEHRPKIQYFARPDNKPWYNAHLYSLRRIKGRLFSRFCKSSGAAQVMARGASIAVRNLYVAELRRAERHFYRKVNQ